MNIASSKIKITTLLIALGACVAVVAGTLLFFEIKKTNERISVLQNQLDIEVRQDQRLRSMKQLLADLDGELKMIDTYFIAPDGVVGFLEEFESFARVSNASLEVSSVGVAGEAGLPFERLRVEFASQGSWTSLMRLVSLLETLPFGITIERSQLERLPNSFVWQGHVSFTALKLK